MTNDNIKEIKSKFVRRPISVDNYNWYFRRIKNVTIPHIVLDVYKNNDVDMYGMSGNSNIEEFKIKLLFKGDVVRNNNFLNISNKHNYYSLFNNICKGIRKYEILRTDDLEENLFKFFKMHCIDVSEYKYWEQCMIAEILINCYIIKKYIYEYGKYDIYRMNMSSYFKYINKINSSYLKIFIKVLDNDIFL